MTTKSLFIRKAQFGFGVMLLVLLVVGVVSYRSLIASAASQSWVQHTQEVLRHLERLRAAMERMDVTPIREEVKTLQALTADNPAQQRRLTRLAALAEQSIQLNNTGVRSQKTDQTAPSPQILESRSVARDMEDEENRLLRERNAQAEQRVSRTQTVLVLGGVLGLLIAAASGWILQHDFAARERAEVAVLDSEERFRLLVEGVQDYAIFTLDPDGRIVSWNAGAERIKGYEADEIIGQNFSRFYPPEDIDQGKPREELQIAAASGQFETQRWRVRKDGSRFWANLVLTATRNPAGDLLGFSEISRDISERKETEAKYRGLLEAAPDAMVVVDQGGEIVLLNLQAEKQFGYHRDELVGQRITNIIPAGFAERLIADGARSAADALAQQIGTGIELIGRRRDGSEFPIEIMLSPLQSAEGILVTAAIRNITKRKDTEEHLVKTVAELRRSNDELEQFAYVASHDLQEPLRMVASYTQLLAKRYQGRLDADADEFIAYAVDGANRMQGLIQDLLAYSRAGADGGARHEVLSERALQDALGNLGASIADSGATVTHDALPAITTDPTQLTQIFQNLVANAIKYRSAAVPQVHVSAAVSAAKDGGGKCEWIFSVRDNGMGIEPQHFDKIFVLFQRLHGREEYAGTGIGLAICKKMLERLGGRIWLESQLGRGSTFHFSLPQGDGT